MHRAYIYSVQTLSQQGVRYNLRREIKEWINISLSLSERANGLLARTNNISGNCSGDEKTKEKRELCTTYQVHQLGST